jgi:molecular chaperone HscB
MPQSYFALFDLAPRFALAADRLDVAYRELAARVHPDRFAHAAPADRRHALQLTTQANEAYRTLRKPALRAQHLLALRGVVAGETSVAISPGFLLEQIEWRETLSDTRASRDDGVLQRLETQVRTRAAILVTQLGIQLDTDNDDLAAMQSVHQLMFVEKLIADIDEALALLEA